MSQVNYGLSQSAVLRPTIYERFLKRPLDVCAAVCGLVVGAPLMLVVAGVIGATMGLPVFFKQIRPGRNEELFTLVKFRTMTQPKPGTDGRTLPDAQRLTRAGALIRMASLDELPQMINVLKGDMSFIGPRPLAVQYLHYYSPAERERHRVRPGITGLAQVKGRNSLNWEERFANDIEYVRNISALRDLRILLLTIHSVLKRSNIAVRGSGTIRDFDEHRRDQQSHEQSARSVAAPSGDSAEGRAE